MSRPLRIFLSSPGDVASTREVAAQTIEKLAQDYTRYFDSIEPYLWEHEAMLASGHFQDSIEPPSGFDIVVLILWSRLGTPMPEHTEVRDYRGLDGRAPVTGTEWEYEEALLKAREGGAPDLLVFRNLQPAQLEIRDAARREEQLRQLSALDAFWSRHFANQGMFLGAYTEFANDVDFARALESQLRKLIERRIAAQAQGDEAGAGLWPRAPFRGLEAYEFEHARIFFGQDDAAGRGMLQLVAGAQAGSPFLLVLGASGSGKSSLVKAGIVPRLFVPRRVTGAAFLRRVIFRPSEAEQGEDLFDALARRLTTQVSEREGLAELISSDVAVADLAAHLRGAASAPELPFRLALAALASAARGEGRMLAYESAKLVLVIDQLEELFTNERTTEPERRRFVELLASLARSGVVWVIATMRADFWHRALETPELVRLSEGTGRLDLLAPSPAQLSQMIRRPAEAAGIGFEVHGATGLALNEVVAEEVAREPGALPLLSYLLDQLYRADVVDGGGRVLTYATFETLGRLEGAIAAKAEAVLARCAPGDRDALGSVLFSLVQMGAAEGDVERAIARRTPISAFPADSRERRLVDALLDPEARLLVSDAGKDAEPTVRVAHEALISHWSRARDFVVANAWALKARRRIEERRVLWRQQSGHDGTGDGEDAADPPGVRLELPPRSISRLLRWRPGPSNEPGLLTGIDLGDGIRLLSEHHAHLDPELAGFIDRSAAQEKRNRTRSFRVFAGATLGGAALVLVAAITALVAADKQREASIQQAFQLTEAASNRLRQGDVAGAESVVLEVLAGHIDPQSPDVQAAVSVFQEARAQDAQLAILFGHGNPVNTAQYSRDGRRVVTASYDGTARVWDARTGLQLMKLSGHKGHVLSAAFSPDGRRIVTSSEDQTARVWDAATGAPLLTLSGHGGAVNSAAYAPDGRFIVTASDDKTARIWDANTGASLMTLSGHTGPVEWAVFSPDGRRVATASDDKTAREWDAATGAKLPVLSGHDDIVRTAAFSPDGRFIVTASDDKSARIWDATTGAQVNKLLGHADRVVSAEYSPDGRNIVTASFDKTARIWDATTGAAVAILSGHPGLLEDASYSPDGRRIVTASTDDTARIWSAATSAELRTYSVSKAQLEGAAYSPDGRRIVIASDDKTAHILSATTGAPLTVLSGHGAIIASAAFSPDGLRVVTASYDNSARIWNAGDGTQLLELKGHTGMVLSAMYSPDGRRIVTASYDNTARTWDAATGAPLGVLKGHRGAVLYAAYSPDGRHIVTASADNTARVWDASTGAQVTVLRGHSDTVQWAAYSPDGSRIVTASSDKSARIWRADTGAQLAVLSGHEAPVMSAAFSPDGRNIVTGSADETARIWDTHTGAQLAVLRGHRDMVTSVSYSPDGAHIMTSSDDGTVGVWAGRGYPDLGVQLSWARAAKADPLVAMERVSLGLAPLVRDPAPVWVQLMHRFQGTNPAALAQLGDREERDAIKEATLAGRDACLLTAFEDYARATTAAQDANLPDEAWRGWRYRRATIARLLAADGLMQPVAETYDRVVAR